jgi:hypothetical protein
VANLDSRHSPRSYDRRNYLSKTRDMLVAPQTRIAWSNAPFGRYSSGLDNDKANTAPS